MLDVNKVVNLARSEIGYREAGINKNKYAEKMDSLNLYNGKKNGYAWCDVFVDCMFISAYGVKRGWGMTYNNLYGASCTMSRQCYAAAGELYTTPQVGDQAFFNEPPNHTGIVVEVGETYILTVEGNTSNEVKLVTHYPGKEKMTFGRPNWFYDETDESANADPEQWAIDNGLFIGDRNGNMNFDSPLTRGQLCVVLKRYHDKFSG